jgi:cytochrome c553
VNCFLRNRFSHKTYLCVMGAALCMIVVSLKAEPAAAQQTATPANASQTGNVENGRRSFTTYACSACHGYSGHGGVDVNAPRLASTSSSLDAFVRYVRRPGGSMPRYATEAQVPDRALADIYAFLKSIPPPTDPGSIPLLR